MNKIKLTTIILILAFLGLTNQTTLGSPSQSELDGVTTATLPQPPKQTNFPVNLNGEWVGSSSAALGDITNDGINEIVIGDRSGKVHVYTGTGVKLWEYDTGNMAIGGKPAIGDVDGDGRNEVIVGAGHTSTLNSHGGLYVLDHNGNLQCAFNTGDFNGDGWRDGVYSSPALADLDGNDGGKLEIVFGSWDAHIYMLNHDCTVVWSKFNRDTIWSSPSIGDIDRDGFLDIVIGVDSHDEPNLVPRIYKGGRVEALDRFGQPLPGFPIHLDEVIYSSPALGDIDNDGWLEIAVGTGYYWDNPACNHPQGCTPGLTHYMYVFDHVGQPYPGWPIVTDDYIWASPALADLDNDGQLEIIANSADAKVHAWNANGTEVSGWPVVPKVPLSGCDSITMATTNSPIVADLDGDGSLEVLLTSNWEIVVWNNQGEQLTREHYSYNCPPNSDFTLVTQYTLGGSPAVGDVDGDNDVEVIIGGAASSGSLGRIYAWDFSGSASDSNLLWATFRQNEKNCARHPIAPILSVTPPSITFLHKAGNSDPLQFFVGVQNLGDSNFSWSGVTSDGDLSISPNSGTVGATTETTQATLLTNGLGKGTHQYDITFWGTDGGEQVIDSPAITSVTVYVVDTVYKSFLPMVTR